MGFTALYLIFKGVAGTKKPGVGSEVEKQKTGK